MLNFKYVRTMVSEAVKVVDHGDFKEIKPDGYTKGKHDGTAIGNRDNGAHYGSGGHADIDQKIKANLSNPKTNEVFKSANEYTKKHLGHEYDMHEGHPQSSLAKQYVIGKTYDLATKHHDEYKKAVFDGYQKHRPDIVKATGAKDYDSLVSGSYKHLAKEVSAQFDHMPVKTQYHDGNLSYQHSGEMLRDIHAHKNLTVFRGGDRHEMLHKVDSKTGLNENEKFRAVHDAYGHGIHGNQFGEKGEEIAWHSHSKMFTPAAHVAMTSETRGQNSFSNYSTANLTTRNKMEVHRAAKRNALNNGNMLEANKHDEHLRALGGQWNYAKQASIALPHEMLSSHYDGEVPHSIKNMLHDPEAKKNPTYDVEKNDHKLVDLARHHNTVSHNSLTNPGKFDHEKAHKDLKKIAAVHGYTSLSKNPFSS